MGEGTSVSAVSSEGRLPARAFEVISGDPKLVERCDIASNRLLKNAIYATALM